MATLVCTNCWSPRHYYIASRVRIGDKLLRHCVVCAPMWAREHPNKRLDEHVVVMEKDYVSAGMTIREMYEYQAIAKMLVT